jgi:hypothetical protein
MLIPAILRADRNRCPKSVIIAHLMVDKYHIFSHFVNHGETEEKLLNIHVFFGTARDSTRLAAS